MARVSQTAGLPPQVERPLVAAPMPAFTDAQREASANYGSQDYTFIPGYSDRRTEREVERRKGNAGPKLSHRFHWVRTKRPSGTPDLRKSFEFRSKGYVPVKVDQLPALGITMPPAGAVNADNEIVVGDTTLYVCTAATAAKNERDWRRATDQAAADLNQKAVAGGVEVTDHEQFADNVGPAARS